jgi:8-oxo-dGTP pyrophosphatase MutT (NUDIX family)
MADGLTLWLLRIYRRLPVRARRRIVRSISPNYTVGAMCFIERDDGALLLVRHSYRQRWGVPGGLLERGELPGDAAVREVLEETGARIELLGEPAVVVAPDPQRVDLVYRARLADDDPGRAAPSSPEIVATQWFGPDELPELQYETAQAMVALARSARAPQARPLTA